MNKDILQNIKFKRLHEYQYYILKYKNRKIEHTDKFINIYTLQGNNKCFVYDKKHQVLLINNYLFNRYYDLYVKHYPNKSYETIRIDISESIITLMNKIIDVEIKKVSILSI